MDLAGDLQPDSHRFSTSAILTLRRQTLLSSHPGSEPEECGPNDIGSISFPNPRRRRDGAQSEQRKDEEGEQGYSDSSEWDLSCGVTSVHRILELQQMILEAEGLSGLSGELELRLRDLTEWMDHTFSSMREFPIRCRQLSQCLRNIADLAYEGDMHERVHPIGEAPIPVAGSLTAELHEAQQLAHQRSLIQASAERPWETVVFRLAMQASHLSQPKIGATKTRPMLAPRTILLSNRKRARMQLRMVLQSVHREPAAPGFQSYWSDSYWNYGIVAKHDVGNISFLMDGRRVVCPFVYKVVTPWVFPEHINEVPQQDIMTSTTAEQNIARQQDIDAITHFLKDSPCNMSEFPKRCRGLAAVFAEIARLSLEAGLG